MDQPRVQSGLGDADEPPIGANSPRDKLNKKGRLLFARRSHARVKVERCAGIDVHKKFLAVCVMIGLADQKPATEVRRFGTSVPELERLQAWLKEKGCTEAVMESTGSYWRPVFNLLEGSLKVIFANPEQVKALRGKKTDPKLKAEEMGNLAQGRLRPKIPQIVEALEGHRMSDHHRLLLRQVLKHMANPHRRHGP